MNRVGLKIPLNTDLNSTIKQWVAARTVICRPTICFRQHVVAPDLSLDIAEAGC